MTLILDRSVEPIVRSVSDALEDQFGDDLVGVVAHGSAVKGGVIKGFSDIDLQVYIKPSAYGRYGLPYEKTQAVKRSIDTQKVIDAGYTYLQLYTNRSNQQPDDWIGLFPDGYITICGRYPWGEANAQDVIRMSRQYCQNLPISIANHSTMLATGHRAGRFGEVRLISTVLWPALYSVLAAKSDDPLALWIRPKDEAVELLERHYPDAPAAGHMRKTYSDLVSIGGEKNHGSAANSSRYIEVLGTVMDTLISLHRLGIREWDLGD